MYIEKRSRQVALILCASLAGFMSLLDANIVNISLPAIGKYFGVGTGIVVQIALVYMLVMTGTMIVFGKLADKFGIKPVFMIGFAIFTTGSLLCGLAESLYLLVAFRGFQALGASMLYATGISLISKFIPHDRMGWAFGIFSPVVSLGLLVGNPLGGLITGLLNWHWIFLINVPIGLAAIFLAWKAIPAEEKRSNPTLHQKFDISGGLLSFAAIGLLVFCLSQGHSLGWTNPLILAGLPLSMLLFGIFVWREKKVADPVLDLSLFQRRDFSIGLIISMAAYGMLSGNGIMMPYLLTYGLHINIQHAGFILMTFAVIYSTLSPVTGNLSDHISKTRLMRSGMATGLLVTLAFVLLLGNMHLYIVFLYLIGLGFAYALFITSNNNFIMSVADPDKQSIASSVFKLSTNLGQMAGIIVMEFLFMAAMPAGFKADGAHAAMLTPDIMTDGFRMAYAGGAALFLIALILTFVVKDRSIGSRSDPESTVLV